MVTQAEKEGGRRGVTHSRWTAWVPWGLIAAVVLVYADSWRHPFVYDDLPAIVNNPSIRQLWPIRVSARCVVDLTFRFNYAVGGLAPWGYRAFNVAIHAANALLLYGWLRRLLRARRLPGAVRRGADAVGAASALLWALHPLQTQAVVYVCQRYESMMALCFLGTLYAFQRGVMTPCGSPRRARAWFGAALGCCLLGMGTKEVMAAAPPVALAADWLLAGRRPLDWWRRRRQVHLALWLCLGVLAMLELRMMAGPAARGEGVVFAISPLAYAQTQAGVIAHYLRLALWPTGLCFDYQWPFAATWREVGPEGWGTLALLGATGLLACRRRPEALAGIWFFAILAPSSSILAVPDAACEHRLYLPLAGILVLLVLLLYRVLARGASRRAFFLVTAVLAAACGCLTWQRAQVYRSGLVLWADTVEKRPGNHRARLNLAGELLAAGRPAAAAAEAGQVIQSLAAFRSLESADVPAWGRGVEGVRLYSGARHYALAHNLAGVAAGMQGDEAGAREHFAEAVRLLPTFEDAARNLARARERLAAGEAP